MFIVNCINITDEGQDWDALYAQASEGRRRRADKFIFPDDRKRCLCAELLMRYSLFTGRGIRFTGEPLLGKYGKPYIQGAEDFFFSASHSGKWVVTAYGSSQVGADVEVIKSGSSSIAEGCFTQSEQDYVFADDEGADERFIRLWTLKESYIKYLGTGLSTPLDSFTVYADRDLICTDADDSLTFTNIRFDHEHYLSVCGAGGVSALNTVTVNGCLEALR
jgi:4'-phosphopantetheinyl transferase